MYTHTNREERKVFSFSMRKGTKNQPVDPPIRGVFSTRGAHDQFAWKSMAFWLRRQLCHLTPDSVNQANRLSTVKG
ncbi:Uncharacterized protein APZ42_020388 [Daphnia magna]|uniref:Uncharacterized protein n=1 Tax=Daphnia magna TaxID=35525 RepID=A0A164XJ39_9CRUS|nr:Uncharacterized protein APZ42_020388 [Daphnia magna]